MSLFIYWLKEMLPNYIGFHCIHQIQRMVNLKIVQVVWEWFKVLYHWEHLVKKAVKYRVNVISAKTFKFPM